MKELYFFVQKNALAAIYGGLLLSVILLTEYFAIPGIARYDVIFIFAILFQVFLILAKMESWREVRVILLFHIVATVMELFKTSTFIGSWSYPEVHEAIFKIMTVPLFTGFLYSAVGSYISRVIRLMNMKFINYPKQLYVGLIALVIYINFFTHHFIYDMRYILFIAILLLFWRTRVQYIVYQKVHSMNFIIAGFLSAFFIWLAENVASFSGAWLYPNQNHYWEMVSLHKIGSWFLLLIVSFLLVSLVYQERVGGK